MKGSEWRSVDVKFKFGGDLHCDKAQVYVQTCDGVGVLCVAYTPKDALRVRKFPLDNIVSWEMDYEPEG